MEHEIYLVRQQMRYTKLYLRTLVIWGLLIPIICSGCDALNKSTYQTFALTKGIAHYSFEYRTYYKDIGISASEGWYSSVSLDGPIVNKIKSRTKILIEVWVPSSGRFISPNAEAQLNKDLRMRSEVFESKILDLSDLLIDGVLAKQFVFSERNIVSPFFGTNEKYYDVHRRVYFDHNGLMWRISMRSDSSTADADKADFDYILKTFKFLP